MSGIVQPQEVGAARNLVGFCRVEVSVNRFGDGSNCCS